MLLPPSEPTPHKPPMMDADGPNLESEVNPSTFQRMADWVRSGMDVLWDSEPLTTEAALTQDQLARDGHNLHQAANAGAEGRPLAGGVRGLGQRIRSWLGRVRSWVQRHMPPRRRDKYLQALEDLRAEMHTELAKLEAGQVRLETGQAELEAGQVRLEAGQAELEAGQVRLETGQTKLEVGQTKLGSLTQKLWGETSDHRGMRYEKGAVRAIGGWLRGYARAHNLERVSKMLWSDRLNNAGNFDWDEVRDEYGLPDSDAIRLSDFLLRVLWKRGDDFPPVEMLLVGEVSTRMNEYRQYKISDAYADLTQPHLDYQVLPMQFGVRFSEQNPPPSIPNLVRVQVGEDALVNRESITKALVEPPEELFPILDGTLLP